MSELWLPVVGFEGLYEVSDLGRVRSVDRWVVYNDGRAFWKTGQVLKPIKRGEYLTSSLSVDGQVSIHLNHKLVAYAHIGPRPEFMHICHGPRGKLCNEVANLQYKTPRENNGPDKVRDGTHNRGERQGNSRLKPDDILKIRARARSGHLLADVARDFGVSHGHVSSIVARKSWAHL